MSNNYNNQSRNRVSYRIVVDKKSNKTEIAFDTKIHTKFLDEKMFYNNTDIQRARIPETVETILDSCFYNCSNLDEVILPHTLKVLGKNCFKNCRKIKELELSNTVIEINDNCFAFCENLNSIRLPRNITKIPALCFYGCSNLSSINSNDLSEINLPKYITSLEEHSCGQCKSLKFMKLPNSVIHIGDGAFAQCTSLEDFTFNNNITQINSQTFINCTGLKNIILPEELNIIYDKAFSGCSSLSNIELPESLKEINRKAFADCTSLKEIIIPKNITKIGHSAFKNCDNLEAVTIISNNITDIGQSIFENCSNIKKINVPEGLLTNDIFDFKYMDNLKNIIYNNKTILDLKENEKFVNLINNKKYICINYLDRDNNHMNTIIPAYNISNDKGNIKYKLSTDFETLYNHSIFNKDYLVNDRNRSTNINRCNICLNMISMLDIDICVDLLNRLNDSMQVNTVEENKNKFNRVITRIKNMFNKSNKQQIMIDTKNAHVLRKLESMFIEADVQAVPDGFNDIVKNNMDEIVSSDEIYSINDIVAKYKGSVKETPLQKYKVNNVYSNEKSVKVDTININKKNIEIQINKDDKEER